MSKEIILKVGVLICFSVVTFDLAYASRRLKGQKVPPSGPVRLWTQRMKGAISGLALSRSGKQILVATHPDGDIPGSAKHALLSLWSTQGKVIWEQRPGVPIKDFAVSSEGELVVLSTYGDELIGMDARGHRVWTTNGLCKPFVIQESKRILCYHDDDSESQVAFDVLDWNGKKLSNFAIEGDIVAFKLSEDQKSLVIGLTGGEIVVFDSDFQPLWRKKLGGEVIDLGLSNLIVDSSVSPLPSPAPSSTSGSRFHVAALIRSENQAQKVEFFNELGRSIGEVTPTFPVEQVELSGTGNFAFYYGNSSSGQWVGGASLSGAKELWKQGENSFSRYSGSINLSPGLAWVGVERAVEKPIHRESRIVVFDEDGKKKYDLGLPKDDTAYIFSHRISMVPNWFVVGTDDAKLSVYRY